MLTEPVSLLSEFGVSFAELAWKGLKICRKGFDAINQVLMKNPDVPPKLLHFGSQGGHLAAHSAYFAARGANVSFNAIKPSLNSIESFV